MSRFGRKVIRNHLGRIVTRARKRKGFAKMVRKGKHVKSINYVRSTDGGVMLT